MFPGCKMIKKKIVFRPLSSLQGIARAIQYSKATNYTRLLMDFAKKSGVKTAASLSCRKFLTGEKYFWKAPENVGR